MNEPQLRITGETLIITADALADWSKLYYDQDPTDEVI